MGLLDRPTSPPRNIQLDKGFTIGQRHLITNTLLREGSLPSNGILSRLPMLGSMFTVKGFDFKMNQWIRTIEREGYIPTVIKVNGEWSINPALRG